MRSALALADAEDAWTFVLDVERFACDCFDIADRSELYRNDLAFLRRFENAHPAVGTAPTFQVVDVLRALGYLETCGDVLYPAGIYRKMNMIQEKYDTNNAGIALAKPLGDAVSVRTVLVPAIEKALAENYRAGIAETRLFEVGRCYLPPEGQDAPREFFTVAMAAYGEDVTADSFAADVQTVLRSLGAASVMCFPNNDAIAYQKDTCRLVIDLGGHYLDSNFGQISEVATKNFGIGVPAFMAQLELRSLVEGKSTGRWSDAERERRNRAAQ